MYTRNISLEENAQGLQHIGLPVRDMTKTLVFYQKIGFSVLWRTELNDAPVCFLRGLGITVEAYESTEIAGRAGAVDHIALNVRDIEAAFKSVRELGLLPEGECVHTLPFFERGVRYFTVAGPDAEKIEFNQIL